MLTIQSEGCHNKKVRVYKKIIIIQIKEDKERPYKTFLIEVGGKGTDK